MDKNARRRHRYIERQIREYINILMARLSPRRGGIYEHRNSCLWAVKHLVRLHQRLESAPTDDSRASYLRRFKPLNVLDIGTTRHLLRTVDEMIAALPAYAREDPRTRGLCQLVFDAPFEPYWEEGDVEGDFRDIAKPRGGEGEHAGKGEAPVHHAIALIGRCDTGKGAFINTIFGDDAAEPTPAGDEDQFWVRQDAIEAVRRGKE